MIGIYGDRQTVIDDGVSERITLKKGPNSRHSRRGGQWWRGATDFCARILDASDKPLTDVVVNLRP